MKITDIDTIPVSIPLKHEIEMASATLTERELVIVSIGTDEGVTGLGEFLTATYFSGETRSSAQDVIEGVLGPRLVGENPLNVNAILDTMDALVQGNYFTKAAVEMALQDIRGKYYDVPLFELLGGRRSEEIGIAWHVGSAPPDEAVDDALGAIERGFETIKLKVGAGTFAHDREMVSSIREAIGHDITLHLDANQAWSPAEAIRYITEFDSFGVDIVEQPVHADDFNGLVTVADACDVPILADESVFTGRDLTQCLFQGGYVHPGVKVTKAGGVSGAMQLLNLSELADVPPCPLGMPGESSIAAATMVHLASTVQDLPFGSAIGAHYLEENIVTDPLVPVDGALRPPTGPGIGVELDETKLDALRVD